MGPARIRIRRDPDGVAERFRGYRILLDGEPAGLVRRGETAELVTEAGHHRLQLAIDWGRSETLELELASGQELELRCWTNASPLTALYWATVGRRRYLGLAVC